MELFDIIFRSIFFGYVIWTFIWSYGKRRTVVSANIEEIDLFIIRTVMVFGILHLGTLILNFIDFNSNNGIAINQNMVERAFGNYWFGLWIYPLTYFGLTELFWIDKVRISKVARIIIALVIFGVMHLEKYVILITTFYRDYAIDRTEGFPVTIFGQIGLGWMLNLVIFGFIIFIGLKMKTLYNKLYE